MSKAFTRESDDVPERLPLPRLPALLPPGAKNYLTPDGAHRLREELNRLVETKGLNATAIDARQQLETVEQRIQFLRQCLQDGEVVQPPPPPWQQVRFGATVTVRDVHNGE